MAYRSHFLRKHLSSWETTTNSKSLFEVLAAVALLLIYLVLDFLLNLCLLGRCIANSAYSLVSGGSRNSSASTSLFDQVVSSDDDLRSLPRDQVDNAYRDLRILLPTATTQSDILRRLLKKYAPLLAAGLPREWCVKCGVRLGSVAGSYCPTCRAGSELRVSIPPASRTCLYCNMSYRRFGCRYCPACGRSGLLEGKDPIHKSVDYRSLEDKLDAWKATGNSGILSQILESLDPVVTAAMSSLQLRHRYQMLNNSPLRLQRIRILAVRAVRSFDRTKDGHLASHVAKYITSNVHRLGDN